jgi:hypothetical protein
MMMDRWCLSICMASTTAKTANSTHDPPHQAEMGKMEGHYRTGMGSAPCGPCRGASGREVSEGWSSDDGGWLAGCDLRV